MTTSTNIKRLWIVNALPCGKNETISEKPCDSASIKMRYNKNGKSSRSWWVLESRLQNNTSSLSFALSVDALSSILGWGLRSSSAYDCLHTLLLIVADWTRSLLGELQREGNETLPNIKLVDVWCRCASWWFPMMFWFPYCNGLSWNIFMLVGDNDWFVNGRYELS